MNVIGKLLGMDTKSGVSQNGKQWTKYSYKIEIPVGERYFSAWTEIEGVQLGQTVEVEYEEKPNPTNPDFPFKNIVSMSPATEQPQAPPAPQQTTIPQPDDDWDKFFELYKESVPMEHWNATHGIGTYMRTQEPEKWQPFVMRFNLKVMGQ